MYFTVFRVYMTNSEQKPNKLFLRFLLFCLKTVLGIHIFKINLLYTYFRFPFKPNDVHANIQDCNYLFHMDQTLFHEAS